jgi:8-oxo-dGTP diphosphatase
VTATPFPEEPVRATDSAPVLDVAAAVIFDADRRRVLIARRADHLHQGGLWEFPGGKFEPGERAREALDREIREELDIAVEQAEPLITLRHDYADRRVRLHVWRVTRFSGKPRGLQGQPLRWVDVAELDAIHFPAANQPIVTAARLPDRYAILNVQGDDHAEMMARLTAHAERGIRLVRLRTSDIRTKEQISRVRQAAAYCAEQDMALLVDGSAAVMQATGAAGLHLRSEELMALSRRPVPRDRWLAASCHDALQLSQAGRIGVDFAVLGPVLPTATHPDAGPLGWARFSNLVESATFPVFALGGLDASHLAEAKQAGAQGIAAIRGFQ